MEVKFPKINNRLAFFDFDRTLVAHNYSVEFSCARENDYFAECLYMLTSLENEYKNDKPLPCMQWYVNKLYQDGYGLYVLTHEIFNLRDRLKQEQLKKFYPDIPMTYLTVDTPDHKIDMMTAVAFAEGCALSDVIFVDDRVATINLAIAAGIDAKHLSDIVVMYENNPSYWQQGSVLKPKNNPGMTDTTYEEFINNKSGIPDENLEDVYRECRQLAEMNGRGNNDKDGDTQL